MHSNSRLLFLHVADDVFISQLCCNNKAVKDIHCGNVMQEYNITFTPDKICRCTLDQKRLSVLFVDFATNCCSFIRQNRTARIPESARHQDVQSNECLTPSAVTPSIITAENTDKHLADEANQVTDHTCNQIKVVYCTPSPIRTASHVTIHLHTKTDKRGKPVVSRAVWLHHIMDIAE